MDEVYIGRMKERLATMRRVASLAHDPRIVELVTGTADQLEQDILELEAALPETITLHLNPPAPD